MEGGGVETEEVDEGKEEMEMEREGLGMGEVEKGEMVMERGAAGVVKEGAGGMGKWR